MESHVLLPGGTDLLIKPVQLPDVPNNPNKKPGAQERVGSKKKSVRFIDLDDDEEEEEEEKSDAEEDVYDGEEEIEEDEEESEVEVEVENEDGLAMETKQEVTLQQCFNCKTEESQQWHNDPEIGKLECKWCHRYRLNHQGDLRPPSLYRRKGEKHRAPRINTTNTSTELVPSSEADEPLVPCTISTTITMGGTTPRSILKTGGGGSSGNRRRVRTFTGARARNPAGGVHPITPSPGGVNLKGRGRNGSTAGGAGDRGKGGGGFIPGSALYKALRLSRKRRRWLRAVSEWKRARASAGKRIILCVLTFLSTDTAC